MPRDSTVLALQRAFYSTALWLAQPLLRLRLARRARLEPGYAEAVEERFGDYGARPARVAEPGELLWVHAVSLGETRAAGVLLEAVRRTWPGVRILLTHGTATGRAQGRSLLQPGDQQAWLPWDTPAAVRRFFDHFQPRMGILMETEVWPNLVHEAAARGIPLALANARLNARSYARAQALGRLARAAYGCLRAVWAQTEADAERLRRLGAPVEGVFGNLKFDAAPDPGLLQRGALWRARWSRPVLMLASSREGEEAAFLKHFRHLVGEKWSSDAPENEVTPLLVPRHPQRFDVVAALAEGLGLEVQRRSHWGEAGPPRASDHAGIVCVGDSLGEMPLYYAWADVALLGGSFEPLGGQNLIEAAASGCPLILGPHTFNFAEAAEEAIAAGAALRVADMAEGVAAGLSLLQQADRRAAMSERARAFAQQHRGAAERTAEAVGRLWETAVARAPRRGDR